VLSEAPISSVDSRQGSEDILSTDVRLIIPFVDRQGVEAMLTSADVSISCINEYTVISEKLVSSVKRCGVTVLSVAELTAARLDGQGVDKLSLTLEDISISSVR